MSFQVFANIPGIQFGFNPTLGSQSYSREDVSVDVGNFWDPMIDPSVRDASNPVTYYHEWNEPQQPIQRYIVEPQKVLFTAGHLPAFQAQSHQLDFNRPYEATGPIPHPCELSRRSPSSTCSSATSSGTDSDWYHPLGSLEDSPLSRPQSHINQCLPELEWSSRPLAHGQIPLVGHINLSEVQGFPDPQEVTFQDDEGYTEMDIKLECAMEVDTRFVKQDRSRGHYRHSSDEGIGQSLKSEASPEPIESAKVNGYTEADVDAEGEVVDELEDDPNDVDNPIQEEEEDQDTDYKPKASRPKRRRSNRISPSSPAKKYKVTKSVSRSKSQFQCKTCDHSAKDAQALLKHVAATHTRPYVCTFSFAGCGSTFGNKNEWKRHVYSQHLNLQYWQCNVGACGQSKTSASKNTSSQSIRNKNGSNEFNRKDLFTQHLRRMHSPTSVKKQQKKNPEWEDRLKQLQSSCLKVRRTPPIKTKCPVRQCGQVFEGPTSWDDRMEHVGRHLEKTNTMTNGATSNEVIEQESDEFMIEWALRERIIERRMPGVYKLYNDAGGPEDEDGDADGEDE